MARVTHLFFDLGGTLVDLSGLVPAMASELVARYPGLGNRAGGVAREWVERTAEATSRSLGPGFHAGLELTADALSSSLADAGAGCDPRTAVELVHRACASYLRGAKLYRDASRRLLRSLRSKVVSMGVVTDSIEPLATALLRRCRIESLFDVVIISESIRTYKPDPRIYRTALEAAHAEAASSLFVSDSAIDLGGAARVGMGPVWIRRGRASPGSNLPDGTLVLENLDLLEGILAKDRPGGAQGAKSTRRSKSP